MKSISTILCTVWHVNKYKITFKLVISSRRICRGPEVEKHCTTQPLFPYRTFRQFVFLMDTDSDPCELRLNCCYTVD